MQLTVYKASAGSGKTYRLSVEYIKLLVADPSAYKQILAVTFTNKATEEMKMRILSKLYGMAHRTADANSYIETITDETGLSEEEVCQRAATALHNLLHNYTYFRVETIDSFFQQILRNLARELKLSNNIRLQLDDKEALEKAVDELVDDLEERSQILNWIIDVVEENMEEGNSWRVMDSIKEFGQNIFSDAYRLHETDFDIDFNQYRSLLVKEKEKALAEMEHFLDEFKHILDQHGLTIDQFSYGKSGALGYFLKISDFAKNGDKMLGSRTEEAMQDFTSMLRATDRHESEPIYQIARDELQPLLIQAEQQRPRCIKTVKTADNILKALSRLRLLTTIKQKLEEIGKKENLFLLSDTQSVLSKLIGDQDSPFIFEKIGSQLKHIMIDEFQDTSTNQWRNFRVLLNDTMANANSQNLIVGDVKQSIYRWRNGDWRLLNNIQQFFPKQEIAITPLNNNFRSANEIVTFNNHFFQAAVELEQAQLAQQPAKQEGELTQAYSELTQTAVNAHSKGFIQFTLYGEKANTEQLLQDFGQDLQALISHGIDYKQVAILARDKGSIAQVVEYLSRNYPELPLITEEAFTLDASIAVGIIIDAMRLIQQPENKLARATLTKAYLKYIDKQPYSESKLITIGDDNTDSPIASLLRSIGQDPLPLNELAERIYHTFSLERLEEESAYVCTFFDALNKFLNDFEPDLERFLAYWDETLHRKAIQSDEPNGIRLMTIHKSKGLEFDYVFAPLCDWQLEHRDYIWMTTREEPYSQIPIVPIHYNLKSLSSTVFAEEAQEEHLQNVVDNLNLLYVLFTRPRRSLYVYAPERKADYRSFIYPAALERVAEAIPAATLTEEQTETGTLKRFTLGQAEAAMEQPSHSADETTVQENVFEQTPDRLSFPMKSFPNRAKFLQSNASRQFIEPQEESDERDYIAEGSLLHALFASIHTKEDVPKAIRELQCNGVMENHPKLTERFLQFITARLNSPKVAEWFSPDWQIYNECTIVHRNSFTGAMEEKRPDRVMQRGDQTVVVDFKFGNPKEEHLAQVREYISLLKEMGHSHVEGFLWYVYQNKIQKVEI